MSHFETQDEEDLDRYDDGAVKSYVSIGDIIVPPTNFSGSEVTRKMVEEQIRERYGDKVADEYDPLTNVRTFKNWKEVGHHVKKGEKAIRSITFVDVKDPQGNTVKKYPKTVFLFHYRQVEKI